MARYRLRLRRPRFDGSRTPLVRREQGAARLVLLALGAGLLVLPIWWWTTQTRDGQRIADLILHGRVLAEAEARRAASDALAYVSLASAAIVAACLAFVGAVRGGVAMALMVVIAIGGANATTQLLKDQLERPDLLGPSAYAVGNSFPSGHVTLVTSILLAAILVVPRGLRTWTAAIAALVSSVAGASTMILGWHRLADVVGGMLISLAWASIVTAALVMLQGRMPRRTWGRGRGGAVTGVALLLAGVLVGIGLVALMVDVLDQRSLEGILAEGSFSPRTLAAAIAVATGSSLVVFAGYVWAMRGVAFEAPR
jgi:membrane-associated phospholipid phosphatase